MNWWWSKKLTSRPPLFERKRGGEVDSFHNFCHMTSSSGKRQIIQLSRENRKNMTPSEEVIWEIVRNRRLDGKKFLCQHVFYYGYTMGKYQFFVVDFYCAGERLVLEVDGGIHEFQQEYDEQRSMILKERDLHILRIKNEEVKDIERVKEKIRAMFLRK
jgi:very-short-patch-repair endonuclease